jgi:hypothetical protein
MSTADSVLAPLRRREQSAGARVARLRVLAPVPTTDASGRIPVAVPVLAVAMSVVAIIWSARTHSMFLYGDARAHLDVSRRVTDGLRTGPTQLGSVWLPLPHIMMVPFTAVRLLWHSGAAGWIVSGACYVYACTRIFSLVDELTDNRVAAWVGFGVFAVNLNLLYLQTTALTEPVLLAFLVGATFHIARWMRTFSVRELVWAAALTMFATLTRYEGWAFLIAGAAVVLLWSVRADRRRHSPEANVVVYSAIGGYGIVLWFIYNLTIFHNALYFLSGQYSASVMNGAYARFGLLGTKGNLAESVRTYGWDMLDIVGPAIVGAAIVGLLLVLFQRHAQRARTMLILALLATPALFEVISLYLGQTTIRVPQRPPFEMYNDRYGLMALPVCAVAIAIVISRRRSFGSLLVGAALIGVVVSLFSTPLTLADGRTGISSATAGHPELLAAYLHTHYRGGRVLADDSEASIPIFGSNLNLREFVTPGSHPFWDRALAAPADHVRWMIAVPNDAVSEDRARHPDRFEQFRLAFTDGDVQLYERVDQSTPVGQP